VKILEAFAHGCPVVSTLAGAEGIDAVPGREIELAAGAEDFANWTAALLQDRELNGRIGSGGHALALREYDSVVQRQKLVERLREALIALAPTLRNASEPASFEMRTV
jgi:glycosyltransferase involved in cell wall biosynthesis